MYNFSAALLILLFASHKLGEIISNPKKITFDGRNFCLIANKSCTPGPVKILAMSEDGLIRNFYPIFTKLGMHIVINIIYISAHFIQAIVLLKKAFCPI